VPPPQLLEAAWLGGSVVRRGLEDASYGVRSDPRVILAQRRLPEQRLAHAASCQLEADSSDGRRRRIWLSRCPHFAPMPALPVEHARGINPVIPSEAKDLLPRALARADPSSLDSSISYFFAGAFAASAGMRSNFPPLSAKNTHSEALSQPVVCL